MSETKIQVPDGPDVSQWTCQLSGYTFTQEEADAICEYVRTASHPIRAGFNGEPVASNVEFTNALKAVQGEAPEPEVPESIKDLLYRTRGMWLRRTCWLAVRKQKSALLKPSVAASNRKWEASDLRTARTHCRLFFAYP